MLISPATAAGIADGSVTLAFRRWDRPRMRPGSTQRTTAGVIRIACGRRTSPSLGRETLPFKRDVRKLTELGLTRSLPVGYEISPRGRAYLG